MVLKEDHQDSEEESDVLSPKTVESMFKGDFEDEEAEEEEEEAEEEEEEQASEEESDDEFGGRHSADDEESVHGSAGGNSDNDDTKSSLLMGSAFSVKHHMMKKAVMPVQSRLALVQSQRRAAPLTPRQAKLASMIQTPARIAPNLHVTKGDITKIQVT